MNSPFVVDNKSGIFDQRHYIEWIKKRYHEHAQSKYTVTNNEIKQQESLKNLVHRFADSDTHLIRVDQIHRLLVENGVTITLEKFNSIIYGDKARKQQNSGFLTF